MPARDRTTRGAYTAAHRALRKRLLADLPTPCPRCGQVIPAGIDPKLVQLDHVDVPVRGGGVAGEGLLAHRRCNARDGAATTNAKRARGGASRNVSDDVAGGGTFFSGGSQGTPRRDLSRSKRAARTAVDARELHPRLEQLVLGEPWVKAVAGQPPADATLPRVMSGPHPRAVGSYGDAWLAFCLDRLGWVPRWWQSLVAARLLEHDAAGELVWARALVSTTRQVGKSTVLRSLALFRVACPEVFARGGAPVPQVSFLASTTLKLATETMRPAMLWADSRQGWRSFRGAADPHVEGPDGGRWLLGAAGSSHGFTVNLPITDEAWGIEPVTVADHMEPTMLEAQMPQFLVTSTAHQDATLYVPAIRAQAHAELEEPDSLLIVEWSAPAGTEDVLDERAWRAASPAWSVQRERLLRAKVAEAGFDEVSFRTQYLNVWPDRSELVMRHALADPGLYARSQGPAPTGWGEPLVVAIEDFFGTEAAVAVAEVTDGKVRVSGQLCDTRTAAWDYADALLGTRGAHDVRLLVGASLGSDPRMDTTPVSPQLAGAKETRTGIGLYRSLLRDGVLVHDATAPDLTRQMLAARLSSTSTSGLRFAEAGERHDLANAAIWAVQEAATRFGLVGEA